MAKRGRKPIFNSEQLAFIRSNPEALSVSEMAIRFAVCMNTIKRVRGFKGAYSAVQEA